MVKVNPTIRDQTHQKTKDGKFNLKIRVSHKGNSRYIGTDLYIIPDQLKDGVIVNHPQEVKLNIEIRSILNLYNQKILDLGNKVNGMNVQAIVDVLREVDTGGRDGDFIFTAGRFTASLIDEGRIAYGKSIESTVNKIKKQNKNLPFSQITRNWLEVFASNLHAEGNSQNTISIHLRNIRVVYNRAIQGNLISRDMYPFFDYKIKSVKTRKRGLDVESIRKIRDVELKKPWLIRARDLFMLSFYLNGINFKDLVLAMQDQVYQGRLNFNRAKTGRSYSIKIFPEAQEIIDRYKGEKYLLRMIEDKEKRRRKKVRSVPFHKDIIDYTNELLKILAGEAKVPVPLSTYYARHSLATIARNIGISRDDIGAILGHGQDTVTDIYIDLDQERIDNAMRKVLDAIN